MAIIARCENPNHPRYRDYGGRGIAIFPEWRYDFVKFAQYVETVLGPPSNKQSLDRIDNSLGYVPGNLRWADHKTQSQNRRHARLFTWGGVTLCLSQWAELLEIDYDALRERVNAHDSLIRPQGNDILRGRKRAASTEWYLRVNKRYVGNTDNLADELDALRKFVAEGRL